MVEFPYLIPRRNPYDALFGVQHRLNDAMSYRQPAQAWLDKVTPRKIEEVPKYEIGPDNVYLGHTSLDYSERNVFAPPIPIVAMEGGHLRTKPKVILVLGEKGSGKSLILALIAFAYIHKYHLPSLMVDPAPNPEWYMHQYPLTKVVKDVALARTTELFTHFPGMSLHGHTAAVYRPAFDSQFHEEGTNVDYALTLDDLRSLAYFSLTSAVDEFLNLLNLEDSRPAGIIAEDILLSRRIHTFSEFITAHEDEKVEAITDMNGANFVTYLKSAIRSRRLADRQGSHDLIRDARNLDYVVLRGKARQAERESAAFAKYQSNIKISLMRFLNERRMFVSGTKEERIRSQFDNPAGILVVPDELKELIPASGSSYTRDMINDMALLDRKNGTSIVGATQNADLISPSFIKSCDYILFSHIQEDERGHSGTADALRAANVPKYVIDAAKKSPEHIRNSLGFPVNQWHLWDKRRIYHFYPGQEGSAYKIT